MTTMKMAADDEGLVISCGKKLMRGGYVDTRIEAKAVGSPEE